MRRIILIVLLMIVIALTAWFGLKFVTKKSTDTNTKTNIPAMATATVLIPAKPLIDFSLIDTHEKPFTQSSLLGHWTLLYFGYAQCPEICPRTLTTISEVWNLIPAEIQGPQALRFVFVSLDPKYDSVADLKKLLGRFNSNFIGLTGEEAEVQNLMKVCSIHSFEDKNVKTQGPKMIDHSATLLLINPHGRIHALFSPPHQKEAITADLKLLLNPIS